MSRCPARPLTAVTCSGHGDRLSCMSSCFSLYSPLAPHHNLARYCIQASCPAGPPATPQVSLPPRPALRCTALQLDCFARCSSHVSVHVAPRDWEAWAGALSGPCQARQESYARLECADNAVWSELVGAGAGPGLPALAPHCKAEICRDSLLCARDCLNHVLAVAAVAAEQERSVLMILMNSMQ